jgi:hypothetical protein
MRFVCSVNGDKYKEIMTYNQIMNHIEQYQKKMALCGGASRLQDMKALSQRVIQCGEDPPTMSVLSGKMGRLPMSQ